MEKKHRRTFKEFVAECKQGVNYGPKPFECIWMSANLRYVIVRIKGHRTWSGIGRYRYSPTEYYLFDLFAPGMGLGLFEKAKKKRQDGRLSKETKKAWQREFEHAD